MKRAKGENAMSKHTDLPWEAYLAGDEGDVYISTPQGNIICEKTSEDDAKFIVRACNAHTDLLAALEAIITYFPPEHMAMKQAREALALAKGESL